MNSRSKELVLSVRLSFKDLSLNSSNSTSVALLRFDLYDKIVGRAAEGGADPLEARDRWLECPNNTVCMECGTGVSHGGVRKVFKRWNVPGCMEGWSATYPA
ncbi:hypothetical protein EVAR_94888_1 [Eumeta japonica]|uniref:Uncharacterized protein n=1 Tax=Eumeta variegata TaxID=151549 RepID=A0A4C1VAW6_EUMVA|nr:hypothetical protein EVAR_94888_1 [Eumeta japonica]